MTQILLIIALYLLITIFFWLVWTKVLDKRDKTVRGLEGEQKVFLFIGSLFWPFASIIFLIAFVIQKITKFFSKSKIFDNIADKIIQWFLDD